MDIAENMLPLCVFLRLDDQNFFATQNSAHFSQVILINQTYNTKRMFFYPFLSKALQQKLKPNMLKDKGLNIQSLFIQSKERLGNHSSSSPSEILSTIPLELHQERCCSQKSKNKSSYNLPLRKEWSTRFARRNQEMHSI